MHSILVYKISNQRLISSVLPVLATASYNYELCCNSGMLVGNEIFYNNDRKPLKCNKVDEKVLKSFTGLQNAICKTIHRQCCESSGKSNYCKLGISLAK